MGLCTRVCRDKDEVWRVVEGYAATPPLCGFTDRSVYLLVCRVVAVDAAGLVMRTFSGDLISGVWFVAEWAFVRRGVAMSLS
jgi:hypothetical protein